MKPRKILFVMGSILILFASSAYAQGTHTVQPGETLSKIAQRYGMALQELQSLNGIYTYMIYPGQELAIPDLSLPAAAVQPAAATNEITHVVQRGEILGEIAKRYDVALQELQSLNDIHTYMIYPGQELTIPVSSPATVANENAGSSNAAAHSPAATSRITHVVQRGEVLGTIAERYDVTVADLMSVNGLVNPHRIDFGQELHIWVSDSAAATTGSDRPGPGTAASPEARQQYIVQRGEYLSQIGYKLGISWVAIAELNGLANAHALYPGMTLVIPNSSDLASYQAGLLNYHNFDINHPGARVGTGRELVVVLHTQMAYAYEDGILKRRAVVSTGLPATPTVQGDFAIYNKTREQTMTGPGYDLDNVEWVMYFYKGYGLHGTWWHNNFGQPMSHGCVNMTNTDAKWFYDFASIGTPVHVRFH